jgi:predicted MFS family arabinose efflux permease
MFSKKRESVLLWVLAIAVLAFSTAPMVAVVVAHLTGLIDVSVDGDTQGILVGVAAIFGMVTAPLLATQVMKLEQELYRRRRQMVSGA